MLGTRLVTLPVHRHRLLVELLHAIHAHVADAAHRILADHRRHGHERPTVFGPAVQHGDLVEIDLVALPHDVLTRRRAALGARRKLRHFEQSRQQGELAEEPIGDLEIHQRRDAVADGVKIVNAKRHRHATHGAEQVDRHRILRAGAVAENWVLKQQRLATTGHLGHAVGNLGDLEMHLDRFGDAMQFAGAIDGGDKIRQRIERHQQSTGQYVMSFLTRSPRESRRCRR